MAPHREQAQGSPTNAADEYECNDCQRKIPVRNIQSHGKRCPARKLPPSDPAPAPASARGPTPPSSAPQPPPGSGAQPVWACGVCTLENDEAIDVCAACEQPRRAQHQQQQPQPPQPMQQPPTQPAQTQPQAAATPAAVWKCALCTLHNDLTLNVSQVCGYSPYSPYQPPPATAASQAPQQQHTPQRQAAAAGGGPLIDAAAIARASAAWGARFRPLGQGSIPTMGGAAAMAKSIAAAAAGAKRARISLQQMGPGGGRGGAPEATLDWIQRYAADHPGTFSLRPLPADSPLGRWLLPEVTKQLGGAHLRGRRITVHEVASCFQRDYVELTERQYRDKGLNVEPRWVWHGSSLEAIAKILSHGFVVTPSAINGRVLGHGIYLAPLEHAVFSAGYAVKGAVGGCHLLLCKLWVSKYEQLGMGGQQFQAQDPTSEAGQAGNQIVVWQQRANTNILPVCLVSLLPS